MNEAAYPQSYYAATAHHQPPRPALAGATRADVCVVGAGYSGLHAALNLAERGYKVTVLEAARVGWGASGRNGGQICTGFNHGMEPYKEILGGDAARQLFDLAEEAKNLLAERVRRHAIDCDLVWGYVTAAEKRRHLEEAKADVEEAAKRYGYDKLRLLDRDAMAAEVDSPRFIGGLADSGAGHLHPLNYCLGLARAAEAAGIQIHEDSRVTLLRHGAPVEVETATGSVKADFLVLACNAYLDDLAPEVGATVMPTATYMTATEVLGENRARALIPKNPAIGDFNFVTNYFRRSADHRLLFGGGVSYTAAMPADLPRRMRATMLSVFPQLADVKQDFTWGGNVAITMNRKPHLGRTRPNVYFAQGYSGMGVAMTAISGKVIAEAIAGQAERFDLFAALPHRAFPGGRHLRAPTLALAMTWFRLRDRL
ncbi:MAG: FAD-binding oxidoreductase [Rhodospirillales bacterium]